MADLEDSEAAPALPADEPAPLPDVVVGGVAAFDPLSPTLQPPEAGPPSISVQAWAAARSLRRVDAAGFLAHVGPDPRPQTLSAWSAAFASFQQTPIK